METRAYIRHRLGCGRPGPGGVHRGGPADSAPALAWHPANHQLHRRPRPSGRLHPGARPGGRRNRPASGAPKCWGRLRCPGPAGCEPLPRRSSSPPSARFARCSSRPGARPEAMSGARAPWRARPASSLTGGPSTPDRRVGGAEPVLLSRLRVSRTCPGSGRSRHQGGSLGRPARSLGVPVVGAQPTVSALSWGPRVSRLGRHPAEAPSAGSRRRRSSLQPPGSGATASSPR